MVSGMLAEVAECTHEWRTCPIHSRTDGLPPFRVVLTCLYGGMPTVDGDAWDQRDSDEVVRQVAESRQK